MKKPILKRSIIVFILIMIIFLGSKAYFHYGLEPVNAESQKKIMVEIPQGASSEKISKILVKNKVIKNSIAFRILCKISESDGKMKAGKYLFGDSMSANNIMNMLVKGEVMKNTITFTIPEGFEFDQIVDKLDKLGIIDRKQFIQIANNGNFDYKFLKNVPKSENRLEGFLFPDTYEVSRDASEEEIIKKMLDRFDEVFKEEYYQRAKDLNISTIEIVTLASIIEREAKVDKERPLVSSVFYNRIKKGIPLQSCATVQYVLDERKENLTLKDIKVDSLYNTYQHKGLPPKPIASPGEASIRAALYPAQTEYLYFVASKNGEHTFSKNYKAHLDAKNGN